MSFDDILKADEKIMLEITEHRGVFASPVLWTALTLWILILPSGYRLFLIISSICAMGSGLLAYLDFRFSSYAVTDQRVLLQSGLRGQHFRQIPISTIKTIDISQTILGRIFDYGSIKIENHEGIKDTVFHMGRPHDFKIAIQRLQGLFSF